MSLSIVDSTGVVMNKLIQFLKYTFCNHQWGKDIIRNELCITPAEAYLEIIQSSCHRCMGQRTQMFETIGQQYYTADYHVFSYYIGGNCGY